MLIRLPYDIGPGISVSSHHSSLASCPAFPLANHFYRVTLQSGQGHNLMRYPLGEQKQSKGLVPAV